MGGIFAFDGHPNPFLSLLWPVCMQNDVAFEACMLVARASWLAAVGHLSMMDHDATFVHHQANLYALLRERLKSGDRYGEDANLCAIITQFNVDVVRGDWKAARTHFHGMKSLVALRKGIRENSPWSRLLWLMVDSSMAFMPMAVSGFYLCRLCLPPYQKWVLTSGM